MMELASIFCNKLHKYPAIIIVQNFETEFSKANNMGNDNSPAGNASKAPIPLMLEIVNATAPVAKNCHRFTIVPASSSSSSSPRIKTTSSLATAEQMVSSAEYEGGTGTTEAAGSFVEQSSSLPASVFSSTSADPSISFGGTHSVFLNKASLSSSYPGTSAAITTTGSGAISGMGAGAATSSRGSTDDMTGENGRKIKWMHSSAEGSGRSSVSPNNAPSPMFRYSLYEDAAQTIPVIPQENMVFSNDIKRSQFRCWMAMIWHIAPSEVIVDNPTFKNEKVWKANPPHYHLQCTLDWAIVLRRRPNQQSTWIVVSYPAPNRSSTNYALNQGLQVKNECFLYRLFCVILYSHFIIYYFL